MQIDFPNSGSTVDSEARAAIKQIISLVRTSGQLPES